MTSLSLSQGQGEGGQASKGWRWGKTDEEVGQEGKVVSWRRVVKKENKEVERRETLKEGIRKGREDRSKRNGGREKKQGM